MVTDLVFLDMTEMHLSSVVNMYCWGGGREGEREREREREVSKVTVPIGKSWYSKYAVRMNTQYNIHVHFKKTRLTTAL